MISRDQVAHVMSADGAWRGHAWTEGERVVARYVDGVLDAVGDTPIFLSPMARVGQLPLVGGFARDVGEKVVRAVAGRHRDAESSLIAALLEMKPASRIVRLGPWESPLNPLLAQHLTPGEGLLASVNATPSLVPRSDIMLRVHSPSWRLPFGDGVFDGATTSSLHLEVDPAAAVTELARVVKVGSRVVVSTVVIRGGRRSRQLARATGTSGGVRAFELDRLAAMLCKAGLAVRDEVLEGRGVVVSAERVAAGSCA